MYQSTLKKHDKSETEEPPAPFIPFVNHHPKSKTVINRPYRELLFNNGIGGFSPDGDEYVITLLPGQVTPAPWVNVLANANFGTVISENGLSYTWSADAHEFRLTPWNNDSLNDFNGEAFYIRDEESGYVWSPCPKPCRGVQPYVIRHGFGYSVFEYVQDGIRSQLWVYVALDCSVKFSVLKVRNESGRPRRLSATGYVEWVLGDFPSKTAMHISTEADPTNGALYARNLYNTEFSKRVAFFHVNDFNHTSTCDRTEFIGRDGSLANPAALLRRSLSGKKGASLSPCGALQVPFDLAHGAEREIIFTLGVGQDLHETKDLIQRFQGIATARYELEAVRYFWKYTLSAIQVETPDPALNVLANGWLIYQTLACRVWGRSAAYQSGGAFGFRDQLQDMMALIYTKPRIVRDHILLCAGHSDDYLWLPLVTCRYVNNTGDTGILEEKVHFLRGRQVNHNEEIASLYEHCKRAIQRAFKFGELGFFLYEILQEFIKIAEKQGDDFFVEQCQSQAQKLRENIKNKGWDGQMSMESLDKCLIRQDQGIHAAVWTAMDFAMLGDASKAWEVFSMINPIHHSGRGGWAWYTGSAGLMYRLIIGSLLGLRLENEKLYIEPCFSPHWKCFKIHYRYRETLYHINVLQADTSDGDLRITDNGQVQNDPFISLVDDHKEHIIQVILSTKNLIDVVAKSQK